VSTLFGEFLSNPEKLRSIPPIPIGASLFDVVVIASSAGGIPALIELLSELPGDFQLPIVIAQHLCPSSRYRSVLHEVLGRATRLCVKWAEDGESLRSGVVYVAPQDRHTMVLEDRLCVSRGEKINWFRPAADPLFFSAAECYGSRTIGVVLSGGSADGSKGAAKLVSTGAMVLTQDEESSAHPCMPLATMRTCNIRSGMTPRSLGLLIASLALPAPETTPIAELV
jgi:two-component system chemotaxis response regulator CheB